MPLRFAATTAAGTTSMYGRMWLLLRACLCISELGYWFGARLMGFFALFGLGGEDVEFGWVGHRFAVVGRCVSIFGF